MRIAALFMVMLAGAQSIAAQEKHLSDLTKTQELSRRVVDLFMNQEFTSAFKLLIPVWPLPKNEIDALEEKTLSYMNILQSRFGNMIGSEKVNDQKIGDFATRETYVIRYEFNAIRLIFTYYRNDKGWVLNGFKWDDQFDQEFR